MTTNLIVAFAYFMIGLSVVMANEHKNNVGGNVMIILLWPAIVLALIIKKVTK